MALLSQYEFLEQGYADIPQCDELCGPFWAAAALRTAGFRVTQEEASLAAGSVLAPLGSPSSLPPGEDGRPPEADLPVGEPAGTSAHGVARAIEQLSGGRLAVVPASGDWTVEKVVDLLARLDEQVVIANVDTTGLWAPGVSHEHVNAYLQRGVDTRGDNDWQVGHFLAVSGLVRGPVGCLVMLKDSYMSRSAHGQPVARFAAALDGRGLLVVTDEPEPIRAHVEAVGLQPALWDNGSPQPR